MRPRDRRRGEALAKAYEVRDQTIERLAFPATALVAAVTTATQVTVTHRMIASFREGRRSMLARPCERHAGTDCPPGSHRDEADRAGLIAAFGAAGFEVTE